MGNISYSFSVDYLCVGEGLFWGEREIVGVG